MIEATINFIISLIGIFVKFLGSIEINLFGYSFSFYSFIPSFRFNFPFISHHKRRVFSIPFHKINMFSFCTRRIDTPVFLHYNRLIIPERRYVR